MTPKHPPGPPMTLGNMREAAGASPHHLIGFCLKDACRHEFVPGLTLRPTFPEARPTCVLARCSPWRAFVAGAAWTKASARSSHGPIFSTMMLIDEVA